MLVVSRLNLKKCLSSMYEKHFKGNGAVRLLRFHQGQRNDSEYKAMLEPITRVADSSLKGISIEITVRTDDGEVFKAKQLQRSTHFPYIVPELVNENGRILITYLTYGSLLRLYNRVKLN